jgi:hypothetical protein
MSKPINCRHCHWLKVGPGERIHKHRVYECTYPIEPLPKLPKAVTDKYGFSIDKLLEKGMVTPEAGVDCPTFARRWKPSND